MTEKLTIGTMKGEAEFELTAIEMFCLGWYIEDACKAMKSPPAELQKIGMQLIKSHLSALKRRGTRAKNISTRRDKLLMLKVAYVVLETISSPESLKFFRDKQSFFKPLFQACVKIIAKANCKRGKRSKVTKRDLQQRPKISSFHRTTIYRAKKRIKDSSKATPATNLLLNISE